VACICEQRNESSLSIKYDEFLDYLSHYWLLKNHSIAWNLSIMWLAGQLNTHTDAAESSPTDQTSTYLPGVVTLPLPVYFQSSSNSVHTNVTSNLIQNLLNLVHIFTSYFSNTIAGPTFYLLLVPPSSLLYWAFANKMCLIHAICPVHLYIHKNTSLSILGIIRPHDVLWTVSSPVLSWFLSNITKYSIQESRVVSVYDPGSIIYKQL
jgi:hypothetical protein